jgi:hypothetical protein
MQTSRALTRWSATSSWKMQFDRGPRRPHQGRGHLRGHVGRQRLLGYLVRLSEILGEDGMCSLGTNVKASGVPMRHRYVVPY